MINCVLISAEETLQRQTKAQSDAPDAPMAVTLELSKPADQVTRDELDNVLAANPEVVFLDLGESMVGLRVLEALHEQAPDLTLMVAGPALDASSLLEVVRAGASEYLPRPFDPAEVTAALDRIRRRLGKGRLSGEENFGDLTTVFSPKGGAGVTTIAVNLAVTLRRRTEEDVMLLDLSPSLGTAGLIMGLHPSYSYLDVIQNFHRIDDQLFPSFLETHESGVQLLSSPARVEDQNGPNMDEVMAVLRFCRRHFKHVVVDAGHSLTSAVDTAFMEATERLLVATPELPTLRNLKRALETFSSLNADDRGSPRLVLNQYSETVGVKLKDVEQGLGLPVDFVIPRESDLTSESINLGRAAVLAGRSGFRRSIEELAQDVGGYEAEKSSGSLLSSIARPFKSAAALV